ncbi:MAG TPA: SDR family NAD(P)-dependent oxidoreductase, partial [Lacibacter sp.]|nr:SDR family NAD(P)-dependent oxidoreductase [Lacibacter sp.]
MLLKNKNAVIYGAGGSLGGAFARAFAEAGATVYISGHHINAVEKLANEINAGGGKAIASEIDAMDEQQVNEYLQSLVGDGHSID